MNRVTDPNPDLLIIQSRDGDVAALGQLLEVYRNYLTVLARVHIGADLQGLFIFFFDIELFRGIGHIRGHADLRLADTISGFGQVPPDHVKPLRIMSLTGYLLRELKGTEGREVDIAGLFRFPLFSQI